MTVPANVRRDRYLATAGQTVFPYTFRIFAAADLVVERLRGGIATTLTLTSHYTVSGVGSDTGGNVTLTAGAVAGDIIAIVSAQPNERSTDFSESGDFRAAAVNAELDRLWIGVQQLAQELARQITAPKSDPPSSYVLPPRGARQNRLLGFDGAGDVGVFTGGTIGGVNVSSFTAPLLELSSAGAWRGGIGAAATGDVTAEAAARAAAISAEAAARAAAISAEAAARAAAIAALPFREPAYSSGDQTITAAGSLTLAHGLTAAPRLVTLSLRCVTAELGYAVNDIVWIDQTGGSGGANTGISIRLTATQILLRVGGNLPTVNRFSDSLSVFITAANWRLIVEAYR